MIKGTSMRISAKNPVSGNLKLCCPSSSGCSVEQRSLHGMWVQPSELKPINNNDYY